MAETADYAQTPEAHAASHEAGGSDEITIPSAPPEAHADSHEAGGTDELLAASYVNTWTRPGRLYANDGTTPKQLDHQTYTLQNLPENGDRIQILFICDGNETKLNLGTFKGVNRGSFDLYVNGVLDSAGYDDYAGIPALITRNITLTRPIVPGLNTIELRVNGQNASSTNYYIYIYGTSIS